MRKPAPEAGQMSNADLTTEIIELSCQEVDSLTRAFEMISNLCDRLQYDLISESLADVPECEVN